MSEGQDTSVNLYIYVPNKGAPIFFAVAFVAVCISHILQIRRYGDWTLTFLHPLCCLMFTVGFALREYGAFDHYLYTTENLNVYIASTCLVYMSPPLLELANFHVLGRVLYFVPYCAPLHPGRVLTTFGFLSALVETLNAIGVEYLANNSLPRNLINLGSILLKTGLVLQLVVIALFILCTSVFHHRCAQLSITSNDKVVVPVRVMYVSTGLILVRTVYRTVEYFGYDRFNAADQLSPILKDEWFFYVFEATLMLLNSFMWSLFHPRRYLPGNNRVFLKKDGVTESEGSGWKDGRLLWVTFLDPLGWFIGMDKEAVSAHPTTTTGGGK
ncbi:hypothetical protein N0V93_000381 [Gnomoniopsis smithogilvyi]|uniref:RTA1 domain protein n=1 Tax=Gnomoniopsis smithogilvyi TaxID=1191159 RepID=A0A9W8Z3W8_9PEZI|nr:hypothetical protein N0V93_000381 [Gnomoniopsis smithogilvyi]